jgi:AcrR family transcriptional regulator
MVNKTKKPATRSPRVAQKRKRARREILDVAQRILLRDGPDAMTLASVAGELGMTKPAIYHYFPSKEALVRALVTALLEEEIDSLLLAIERQEDGSKVLGTVIRAFYEHYADRLDALRIVYGETQLLSASAVTFDEATLAEQVHPRTRRLFDTLETRLAGNTRSDKKRRQLRQLAFTAWTSALGLMTMISVADSSNDPLAHPHDELLATLCRVFDQAAA